MRLLVSVRSAAEAELAASNGADIVDAKEPDAGPLGPVSSSVLREIELALPPQVPLGVALGDARAPDELARMLDRLAPPARAGGTFLKVGFAGVSRVEEVSAVLRRGVDHVRALGPSVAVIAASYADCDRARAPSPDGILDVAVGAGAAGVLIDTWIKDGRGLLRHLSADALAAWVIRARRAGLLTALAGSLTADDLKVLRDIEPDVVGVRGAVCRGGRAGTIDLVRLQRLRATLDQAAGPFGLPSSGRELPDPGAHMSPLQR
jgi:(5-formylfuran-3-yl)methyl phosphate synthase